MYHPSSTLNNDIGFQYYHNLLCDTVLVAVKCHRFAEIHDNFLVVLRIFIGECPGAHVKDLVRVRAETNVGNLGTSNIYIVTEEISRKRAVLEKRPLIIFKASIDY